MDQSELLTDLLLTLECGICLEQLESTSKVLPCQHTFCLRCLEGIVRSQKELRCPECRTLVEIPIHELPTNILLNRLLEGLKKTANISERKCFTPRSSFRIGQQVFSDQQRRPPDGQSRDENLSPVTLALSQVTQGVRAKALANYDGHGSQNSITFKEGDVLNLLRRVDRSWFEGEVNGRRGLIPASYVRIIPMNAECRALYDFQISSPEQVDCLTFQRDEIITVIRKVDENWAEGKLGDRIGIFPISFVECNPAAKSLLESFGSLSVSTPVSSPVSTPTVPQITACNSSSNPYQTNAKVFSVPIPSSVQVEVSTGINVVTSTNNPTTNGLYEKLVNKRHSFCEVPSEAPVLVHQRSKSHVVDGTLSAQPSRCATNWSDQSSIRTSEGAIIREISVPIYYVAVYNYRPQKTDELELRKGEIYVVSEKCNDGWYRGRSLKTSVQGVFPGNYVQVAKSLPPSNHRILMSADGLRSQGQPPPLLPKPKINGNNNPFINSHGVVPSIYAKPRPNSAATLPWVVAPLNATAKPPRSLPLSSSAVQSPEKSDSSPSPQWPAVKVAAIQKSCRVSSVSQPSSPVHEKSSSDESKSEGVKKLSLMKRWARKCSKSPTPTKSNFYCDNPSFVSTSPPPTTSPSLGNVIISSNNPTTSNGSSFHARSGSCPSDVLKGERSNNNSDPNIISNRSQGPPPLRFRCVIPYPPNSDHELELKVGDMVHVHKKREDGWFKGTLVRTGKVGLFPGSFVESC